MQPVGRDKRGCMQYLNEIKPVWSTRLYLPSFGIKVMAYLVEDHFR